MVSVPAAVRAGQVTTTSRAVAIGPYGMLGTRTRSVHVGSLAVALRAPRRPSFARWPALAVAVAGLLTVECLQIAATGHSGVAAAGAVFWLVITTVCGARLRNRFRDTSGAVLASRALYLWRRSLYCGRCGVVTVTTTAGSAVLPADPLAPHLSDLAARLQWRPRQDI